MNVSAGKILRRCQTTLVALALWGLVAATSAPQLAQSRESQDATSPLDGLRTNLGANAHFELRVYTVTAGKLAAVVERFRDTVEPVRRKHGIDTVGYWTAPGTTNGGHFVYLMISSSKEELQAREKEFGADPQFKEGYAASQKKYGSTVDRIESFSLTPCPGAKLDFSPANRMRTFELRIYSIEPGQLDSFQDRWRDKAVPIYKKMGLHCIGWWTCAEHDAQGHEQFVCLLAGDSEKDIQRAISEFHADAEWINVEKETERNGKLRSGVVSYTLTPTNFSPLK